MNSLVDMATSFGQLCQATRTSTTVVFADNDLPCGDEEAWPKKCGPGIDWSRKVQRGETVHRAYALGFSGQSTDRANQRMQKRA